jgi:hypothetical protein
MDMVVCLYLLKQDLLTGRFLSRRTEAVKPAVTWQICPREYGTKRVLVTCMTSPQSEIT